MWKPYIILEALSKLEDGDFLFYSDSGLALIQPLSNFIEAMEESGQDVMCFAVADLERRWSKRDAFILMDCDNREYYDTLQIMSGVSIFKKSEKTVRLAEEWLTYAQDKRIVTDEDNVLGSDNYEGFIENRHDQTAWSLLCKKYQILPFRDPSEYGMKMEEWPAEIIERSSYGQVMIFHRKPWLHSDLELFHPNVAKYLKLITYKSAVKNLMKRIFL